MSIHLSSDFSIMRHAAQLAATLLLALPAFAFAQADDTTIPAATCVKPVVPAVGVKLDKKAAEKLNGESTAYAACASAYIAERRAIANKHQVIVTAQTAAANAFASDFNAYATALETYSTGQKADTAKSADPGNDKPQTPAARY